ncbi:putative DNA-binding transcriptional regulator AlpA [Nocardioides sp. BE266]|nr:putative DNA-binding transcriptional regulator AlpA [Nocardioides sp. BE266]
MLGVSRQRVTQLAAGPTFPKPVAVLSVGRIWIRQDVVAWAEQAGRSIRQ